MGDITVTKLADKRIADNAGSVSGTAIKHDGRIWRWHNGGEFRLKFRMQLPRLGKGGNGVRAFDDSSFGPFFSAADINHHNAVFLRRF